jgi:coproporphyrinogen III oxidase-like Fe-S oxidoreductase
MGMRLSEGIDLARFAAIGGRALDAARIASLAEDGLVRSDGRRLAATPKGRLVLDRLIVELAPG